MKKLWFAILCLCDALDAHAIIRGVSRSPLANGLDLQRQLEGHPLLEGVAILFGLAGFALIGYFFYSGLSKGRDSSR